MPSIKDIPKEELESALKWVRVYAEWKVGAQEHADPSLDPGDLVEDTLNDRWCTDRFAQPPRRNSSGDRETASSEFSREAI